MDLTAILPLFMFIVRKGMSRGFLVVNDAVGPVLLELLVNCQVLDQS